MRDLKLGKGSIFFSSPNRPCRVWGPHRLLLNGYRCTFPRIKQPGCGCDHSPTCHAVVGNKGSYTTAPPLPARPSRRRQDQLYLLPSRRLFPYCLNRSTSSYLPNYPNKYIYIYVYKQQTEFLRLLSIYLKTSKLSQNVVD